MLRTGVHFKAVSVTFSSFRCDVLWSHTSSLDSQGFIIGLNVSHSFSFARQLRAEEMAQRQNEDVKRRVFFVDLLPFDC